MTEAAASAAGEPRLLWSWDTEWPADTAEFCPVAPYRHLLLCGTYKLRHGQPTGVAPEECVRDGRLHLLDCGRRRQLQRLETAALLDVSWCPAPPADGCPLAAAVDAGGRLLLLRLAEGPRLQLLLSRQVAPPGRLALALDWVPAGAEGAGSRLAVSDSSGGVTVLRLDGGPADGLSTLWTAACHRHEAWTCAFNHRDSNIVYTGGDDLLFRCYDVRMEPESPVFTNRSHEAGVTSIQSDPFAEHTLRTGSYDEHLYTWDCRSLRRPVQRAPLAGGVWRIKRHPRHAAAVLTACMYGGSQVTDPAGGLLATFRRHRSIVYGADWCPLAGHGDHGREWVDATPAALNSNGGGGGGDDAGGGDDCGGGGGGDGGSGGGGGGDRGRQTSLCGDPSVVATCSFYDNLLCLWEI